MLSKKAGIGIIICVILGFMMLAGIGLWIKNSDNPADATYSASWQSDGNEVYFNEISNDKELSEAKLVLPDGTRKELTLEEVNQYYGRDMSDCYIPENLKQNNTGDKFDFYYDGDAVTSDCTTIWYSAEGESTNDTPYLAIQFEKERLPQSDEIYTDNDVEESTINGKKITFTAEFPEGSSRYTAEFLDSGIGYRISGNAISQEEFMKVIDSLLD